VLRGVDLTLERGQCLVIFGGSGSGKCVLFKTVLGVITPVIG